MEYKNYYDILGISKNADEKEIKSAFRKLAQQYHPDKNPDDSRAEERFKEVNEAYTVLSDSDKRSKYDRFGSQWEQYARTGGSPGDFDWSGWMGGSPGGGRGTHTRTVSPEEFEQMFGGGGTNRSGHSSFFDALFGGMGGRTGTQFQDGYGGTRRGFGFDSRGAQARQTRRQDVPVEVTLEEAFHGTTRLLRGDDGKRLEVNIPRGVKTGSRVRMRSGATDGDIYLKVTVLPHASFGRDGNNLRILVPVDLYTAVLGGEAQVPTLERPLVLTIPPGTPNGKVFRLSSQGMPSLKAPDQRGDLLAEIEVTLPTNLSGEEKELFEKLRSLSG